MATPHEQEADELHERARELDDPGQALAMYQRVLELDPKRPTTLYNIGLIHKYRGDWQLSREFNKRAVHLSPEDEAANWNLAIAATALRDWTTARAAWRRLGILETDGEGPIEEHFGKTPVRLSPDDSGEVVWGDRIDPVRVRVLNVPYPESGFRYGDIVLHDGAPVGSRESEGREYSVFNVLELFEASSFSTYQAEVRIERDSDAEELTQAFDNAGVINEDWTRSVRFLCKQCSEGRVHEQHDHDLQRDWQDRHLFGLAVNNAAEAQRIIAQWSNQQRWLVRLELKLSPPVRH
jgi:tetratricopeptide (TPR) repeat protein